MKFLVFSWSLLATFNAFSLEVSAFRGMHQPPHPSLEINNETCTASHIADVKHTYLENTIEGIRASFEAGATFGHFNIHRTADKKIVVFHDWTVDCRTNGTGQTNQLQFDYLRSLNIGYGYRKFDSLGNPYYPFRNHSAQMPTVREILEEFPDKEFLVYPKDSSQDMIHALANDLAEVPESDHKRLHFIGEQTEYLKNVLPNVSIFNSLSGIKQCVLWYLGLGWSKFIHKSCKNTNVALPVDVFRKFFRSRSKKFIEDLKQVGSKVWVLQVDNSEDWEFALSLDPYGVGTYRMDKISTLMD